MTFFIILTVISLLSTLVLAGYGFYQYKTQSKNGYTWSGKRTMHNFFIAAGAGAIITSVIVLCLINIETEYIDSDNYLVSFKCSKVRVGNYSETVIRPCTKYRTDRKGNRRSYTTTCSETHYWTEPASEVIWTQMRTNRESGTHELTYTNAHDYNVPLVTLAGGLVVPADPPSMWKISTNHLNNVSVNVSADFTMNLHDKDGKWISDAISKTDYFKALDDIKNKRYRVIERLGSWVITNNTYENIFESN